MLKSLLIYGAVLALLLLGLPLLYPLVWLPNAYSRALEKKLTDVEKVPSPRVLLAGGSNVAFGLDSKRLSEAWHRPVYNLALSADLGLERMTEMAVVCSRPGDILLFSPEYLCGPASIATLAYVDRVCPAAKPFIHPDFNDAVRLQYQLMLATWHGILRPLQGNDYDPWRVYRADGINAWGDYTAHLALPIQGVGKVPPIADFKEEYAQMLTQWAQKAKEKHVQAYYLPQSYPQSAFQVNKTGIERVWQGMKRCGWQTLCPPADMVFADSLFYDTPNHLHVEGRAARTEIVANLLIRQSKF